MIITEISKTITQSACTFHVKITPSSAQNKILGKYRNALKISIQAPPEKGKANQMLIEFLAKTLNIPKKSISVIQGETQPLKKIQILDIKKEILFQAISPYLTNKK